MVGSREKIMSSGHDGLLCGWGSAEPGVQVPEVGMLSCNSMACS